MFKLCELGWWSIKVKADLGGSGTVRTGTIGGGTDGGWALGASDSAVSANLAFISIFNGFLVVPDSLRSRTPGLVFRVTMLGGRPTDSFCACEKVGGARTGGGGRAPEGGGCKGGGSGLSFNCVAIEGNTEISATVEREVPEAGLEPNELPQVLPEKPLESDSRGKADLV